MNDIHPNTYNGYQIIQDETMTMKGEPYEEPIPLMRRLFSRPWRPFKKTKTIYPTVPSDKIIMMNGKIVMHPVMADRLMKEVANGNA